MDRHIDQSVLLWYYFYMERLPSQERPDLARFGEVFDTATVHLIQQAADELNLTLPTEKYTVKAGGESYFNLNGTRLPDGQQRVIVSGQWEETGDITELWDRVAELRDEATK